MSSISPHWKFSQLVAEYCARYGKSAQWCVDKLRALGGTTRSRDWWLKIRAGGKKHYTREEVDSIARVLATMSEPSNGRSSTAIAAELRSALGWDAGLDPSQLLYSVIVPTLEELGMDSASARALLLGTAAQESRLRFLVQLGGGPALGIYQMEPATYMDILANYVTYHPDLAVKVGAMRLTDGPAELIWNLRLATAMARLHYRRVPEPLPPATASDLAAYWKRHYNTPTGAGTVEEFVANFEIVRPALRGEE